MNTHIIYKISMYLLMGLAAIGQGLKAQTTYDLSFKNPILTANPLSLSVDIILSFDEEGQLGSSNLVIDYDPDVIANPNIAIQNLSASPIYLTPNLTFQSEGRFAFNIELLENGNGDKVGLPGDERKIATLSFELFSTEELIHLNWFEADTRGTVVFSDDPNFTQLSPAKLADITIDPSDFPSEDLILKAVQVGLDAQLEWEYTASLLLVDFEVERSVDGNLFEVIANVDQSANQGPGQAYIYHDKGVVNTLEGTIYYRVKQKEPDGTYITSNTVELTLDKIHALGLQAYPNPVKDQVKIQWEDLGGKAEISLIDPKGKLVRQEKVDAGQSSIAWDLSKLSSGLYFIEYKNPDIPHINTSVMIQLEK